MPGPPRFLGDLCERAVLFDPDGTSARCHCRASVLPSALVKTSAPITAVFRGSITRPTHSLSTLRSPGHPGTTQDSLPAGALLCRAGVEPAGLLSEVSASTLLPPRPGFSWRTLKPSDLTNRGGSRVTVRVRGLLRAA